jgi:hypothetical protein
MLRGEFVAVLPSLVVLATGFLPTNSKRSFNFFGSEKALESVVLDALVVPQSCCHVRLGLAVLQTFPAIFFTPAIFRGVFSLPEKIQNWHSILCASIVDYTAVAVVVVVVVVQRLKAVVVIQSQRPVQPLYPYTTLP